MERREVRAAFRHRTRPRVDHRGVDVKPAAVYGIGRLVFGIAALAVPGTSGTVLAGEGGGAPDAQAFLRGMGGRKIGLGLGLLGAIRASHPVAPWLPAGAVAGCGGLTGGV